MEFKATNLEVMTKVVNVNRSERRCGPWDTQYLEGKEDEEEPGKGQRRSHLSKRRKTRRVWCLRSPRQERDRREERISSHVKCLLKVRWTRTELTISFRDGEAIGNLDKTNFGDLWGLHNWIGVLKDYSVAIKFLERKMTSVGDDVEKLEPLCISGRRIIWYSHCGKLFDGSSNC